MGVKKTLLNAIGTASVTAEKAGKIMKGIVEKGLISPTEAKVLIKKLIKEAEREGKRIQKIISTELSKQKKK